MPKPIPDTTPPHVTDWPNQGHCTPPHLGLPHTSYLNTSPTQPIRPHPNQIRPSPSPTTPSHATPVCPCLHPLTRHDKRPSRPPCHPPEQTMAHTSTPMTRSTAIRPTTAATKRNIVTRHVAQRAAWQPRYPATPWRGHGPEGCYMPSQRLGWPTAAVVGSPASRRHTFPIAECWGIAASYPTMQARRHPHISHTSFPQCVARNFPCIPQLGRSCALRAAPGPKTVA